MHRILKPTGSLYLHCDHTANAYIRMALDAIFGTQNFRNEIVWCYTGPGSPMMKQFNRKHDTVFWYNKGKKWCFNKDPIRIPYKDGQPHTGGFTHQTGEKTGQNMDAEIAASYTNGKIPEDWWSDIALAVRSSKERTGSPDQKPLALYERIVLASSNPGDLVLDPFAGCATTIMAAQQNGQAALDRNRPPPRCPLPRRLSDAWVSRPKTPRISGNKTPPVRRLARPPRLATALDAHFRTNPPVQDGRGRHRRPLPGTAVHTASEKSILTHREMKDYLLKTFGLHCWGCGFTAPDERYLELDHVDPKADGGSNHLDNRALLCKPCNGAKSNNLTMGALRRQNTKDGHLEKPPGTKRGDDGHSIRLPEARAKCREALERHRRGQTMQLGMML